MAAKIESGWKKAIASQQDTKVESGAYSTEASPVS
jgi:hypothetical protein